MLRMRNPDQGLGPLFQVFPKQVNLTIFRHHPMDVTPCRDNARAFL